LLLVIAEVKGWLGLQKLPGIPSGKGCDPPIACKHYTTMTLNVNHTDGQLAARLRVRIAAPG
jgi:hypothetical protein